MAITTAKQLVAAYKRHGSLKAAARKTGTTWGTAHKMYVKALAEGLMEAIPRGRTSKERIIQIIKQPAIGGRRKALKAIPIERHPEKVTRYLFTCAQNNTKLHEGFWESLLALKSHYNAQLHVSRFAYVQTGFGTRGNKKNYFASAPENFKTVQDFWFDERIVPFISDDRREVAPGLVWCGEANILPTAARPLSGLETFTGRSSGIFPHVKIAMDSVPSGKFDPVKFNYTTGTVTQRNYIQRKEGLKAEFHHCYGALLVEVDPEGNWWCRQINADSEGTIYDLDVCVKRGVVSRPGPGESFVEGAKWGDIHLAQIDPSVRKAIWGKDGILDFLHPKYQFMDDILDFFARNHHEIDDPHSMLQRYVQRKDNVEAEVSEVAQFLTGEASRPWVNTVVVNSNHDRALMRWLKNKHVQRDPVNIAFWHKMNTRVAQRIIEDGVPPVILREAFFQVAGVNKEPKKLKFLAQDDSFIICPQAGGGIENGQHGDDGADGSRGSTAAFARMGRKINKGHDHRAAIYDSVYSGGCCCDLQNPPSYAHGPSSWSNSHTITYVNGKRAILTMWGPERKAWADR